MASRDAKDQRYRNFNREKLATEAKARYWADPEKFRSRARGRFRGHRYGLTPEQYDAMLAAQGGHCAICPATEPGAGKRRFYVDHDHMTGKVRGLLCHKCNTGLGAFRDDADLLEIAVVYLKR